MHIRIVWHGVHDMNYGTGQMFSLRLRASAVNFFDLKFYGNT
jgi:hypothetical protein